MNKHSIPRVDYKMLFTVKGKCPHCSKEIDWEKLEEFSDEYPSDSWFSISEALLRANVDEYFKYITENPIFEHLMKVRNEWQDKVNKTLPIVSRIRSETIYVLEGKCPYCINNITLRQPYQTRTNLSPEVVPGELQTRHGLNNCPVCGEMIHIHDGFFKLDQECSHTVSENKTSTPKHKRIKRSNDDANPLFWLNCKKCGADLKEHPFRIGKKYECICQVCDERFKLPRPFINKHPLKPWKDGESLFCDGKFLEELIGKKPAGSESCEKENVEELK